MPETFKRRLRSEDYTVAWLCALHATEYPAARCMLDEEHQELPQPIADKNNYKYGSINGHNVVIAYMVAQKTGPVSAAQLTMPLVSTFPNLKVHLLVGIGGGIPRSTCSGKAEDDVRLGDVVVGWPRRPGTNAVIGWDHASWEDRHGLPGPVNVLQLHDNPDRRVLGILTRLLANSQSGDVRFDEHLRRLDTIEGFGHPGRSTDRLFKTERRCSSSPSTEHGDSLSLCDCEEVHLVKRKPRDQPEKGFVFHRGTILSGSSFMMDAETRDRLRDRFPDALCFEMEAVGVVEDTKALVIRGICDYADEHVNRRWQKHAAGTAAAFARELIFSMPEDSANAAQKAAMDYAFNNISLRKDKHLCKERRIWERMTVSGMAVYEQIYNECEGARQRVQLDVLKNCFPADASDCVTCCWNEISRDKPFLHHGMTIAVIYLVHLQYHCNVDPKETKLPQGEEGSRRRGILRHFATWVSCNCSDTMCPCLWNFANDSGLCRNPVGTCQAIQYNCHPGEQVGYGKDEFERLTVSWEMAQGDPSHT